MIKKNHTTFWVVATIGGISFATSVVFKFSNIANDFGYDISLGTFVGVVVALITVGTDIITTRKAAIQRMLLEVRHIKALHNELCYASTDAEIVRISTEIDKHFDFFQDAMCSIEWIVREDRNVKELFGEVYGYLANIVPILIASANQDPDKLEEAKKRSQCMREPNMNSIMKIWIPLVKKYDPSCLSGNYAMCEDYDYMGSRRDGGFAEYCLVPSAWNFVESHNTDTPMTMLAMAEPACVAQHAVRKSSVYFGANVLIFGAGPIGIMAGRWAKLAGAAKVLFSDVVDAKVEFCKKCGFDAVNSRTQPLEEVVRQTFGGRLADIAIEGTGYGSALNQAITCIRPFGTITLLGNPAADTTITKACHSQLLRKEATIHAIWNSHYSNLPINEWRYTVDQMDSGAFDCTDLISHTCSLDELPEMTAAIHEHRIDTWKVLYTADSAK